MKIKITSDGLRSKIVDAETGEEIKHVVRFEYSHRANELPKLIFERVLDEVEIVGGFEHLVVRAHSGTWVEDLKKGFKDYE